MNIATWSVQLHTYTSPAPRYPEPEVDSWPVGQRFMDSTPHDQSSPYNNGPPNTVGYVDANPKHYTTTYPTGVVYWGETSDLQTRETSLTVENGKLLKSLRGKGWSLTFGVLYHTHVFFFFTQAFGGRLWLDHELTIYSSWNWTWVHCLKLTARPWTLLVLKMKFHFSGLGSLFRGYLSQGMGEKNGPKKEMPNSLKLPKKKSLLVSLGEGIQTINIFSEAAIKKIKNNPLFISFQGFLGDHNFQRISPKIFWKRPHNPPQEWASMSLGLKLCGLENLGMEVSFPIVWQIIGRPFPPVGHPKTLVVNSRGILAKNGRNIQVKEL